MADAARGSERLTHPMVFSPESLESLLKLRGDRSIELVDWCVRGQPGPDGVCGTFQVKPEIAGGLIEQLLKFEELRLRIKVFPLGIPAPDLLHVEFAGGTIVG